MTTKPKLIFLKFGGSLITDKANPLTAREDVIERLAGEVADFSANNPQVQLVIGHGSGSFGHAAASKYQTQDGVHTENEWRGFAEVWAAARALDQIVIRQLSEAGLPVIAFPPSAGVVSSDKTFISWDIQPIQEALSHSLIPVVQGDVIFDKVLGGTIFSTEQIFQHLARELHPDRILLAGSDPGVYRDANHPDQVIQSITPDSIDLLGSSLSGSSKTDVTGGMLSKVALMMALVKENPNLNIQIFSATQPNALKDVLAGENIGTMLHS